MADYEAPSITELGSVSDFTRGEGCRGSQDSLFILGYDTGIHTGTADAPGSRSER